MATARRGPVWMGEVRFGVVRCATVWFSAGPVLDRHDSACFGRLVFAKAMFGAVWFGLQSRFGSLSRGLFRCGMVCHVGVGQWSGLVGCD